MEGGTAQTVTGPIAGNPTLSQGAFSKAPAGYLIQEFFLSGSAAAYGLSGETLSVTGHAPFKTRLVVVRPADDKTFNGTVIVEWLNVSAGTDGAPRSEEHTSELQSLMRISYAVFCLKKKKQTKIKQ